MPTREQSILSVYNYLMDLHKEGADLGPNVTVRKVYRNGTREDVIVPDRVALYMIMVIPYIDSKVRSAKILRQPNHST